MALLDALADIPDPRHRRGIRHPLSAILGLAVVAMLTGCKSYQTIAQFGRDKGFALAHVLGFRRGKTPTKGTYSTLFRRLDVVAFEAALVRWIASRLSDEQTAVIALDGKTVYGITSMSVEEADAGRLLALTRGHWGIENGLHYKRDVTLGEDASRVGQEAAPQMMAALRNSIVHLLDGTVDSLAAAVRTMSNCFNKALTLLGLPQIE